MTEFEAKVKNYYEALGYTVYHVEIWEDKCWSDIEIGGSPEKYHHMRGYYPAEEIQKLREKVGA
jgi:hypothetical protein